MQILEEMEALDARILAGEPECAISLLDRRTRLCTELLPLAPRLGEAGLPRIRAILTNTNRIRTRLEALRLTAARESSLLERQHQLLNSLTPVRADPAYVDASV